MKKLLKTALVVAGFALFSIGASAAPKDKVVVNQALLDKYYTAATAEPLAPKADGFIRRWTILEPIATEISSNSLLTNDFLAATTAKTYFADQFSLIPYNGLKTSIGKVKYEWHALDSKDFYVNLLRFAESYGKEYFQQLYWVVTIIECEEDIPDVRLSAGVNSGAVWFFNEEKVLTLADDKDLICDDVLSKRLTLKKGRNILRGAIYNGPGMADFSLRFVDSKGKPVTNFTIVSNLSKKK